MRWEPLNRERHGNSRSEWRCTSQNPVLRQWLPHDDPGSSNGRGQALPPRMSGAALSLAWMGRVAVKSFCILWQWSGLCSSSRNIAFLLNPIRSFLPACGRLTHEGAWTIEGTSRNRRSTHRLDGRMGFPSCFGQFRTGRHMLVVTEVQ